MGSGRVRSVREAVGIGRKRAFYCALRLGTERNWTESRGGAANGAADGRRWATGTESSGDTQLHPPAEGAEGGLDRVDLGGVIEIDNALNVLRAGIQAPCQF